MANDKRFIEIDWKRFRKLSASLLQAWIYGWTKCDAIGVFEFDPDYARVDLNRKVTENEYESLSEYGIVKISAGKFLFVEYVRTNYVNLKAEYNPHKPAFRALDSHGLQLNDKNNEVLFSSLNKASLKLEEEKEYKEEVIKEGKDENKKGQPKKVLFRDSEYFENKEKLKTAFWGTQYETANIDYYHETILNWSDSKGEKRIDWLATARTFMGGDMKENKFVDINFKPGNNGNQQTFTGNGQQHNGKRSGIDVLAERIRSNIEKSNGGGEGGFGG